MKKQILLIAIAAAMAAAHAGDTYVWTGAGGDGMWTNAANWSLNGSPAPQAPGVPWSEVTTDYFVNKINYYIDTISSAGQARLNENVEFGPIDNNNTAIDLDGLYAIGNITVKAGSPTYTFGTSSTQVIPLQDTKTLTLESGLENMPVLTATLGLGSAVSGRDSTIYIQNNTGRELVIGDIGRLRFLAPRSTSNTYSYPAVYLKGTGSFRFVGQQVVGPVNFSNGVKLYTYEGKVTIASSYLAINKLYMCSEGGVCEVLEGCKLYLGILNGPLIQAEKNSSILGKGAIEMVFSYNNTGNNRGRINVYNGYTLTIEPSICVRESSTTPSRAPFYLLGDSKSGVLYIKGTNTTDGRLVFVDGNRTFKTNHPGGLCLHDTIEFWTNGNVSPAYTNGEDFVKTLAISNGYMATIVNERETTMTARPTVAAMGENAAVTLCSKPVTAPIVLDATITEGQSVTLGVDGAKETRPTAATLAAISGVRLMGGILDVSSVASNWSPAVPVTYDTGNATIYVPDGETYTFSSLGRTDGKTTGTLNIVCGTGRAKISGASAGAAPTGLKVNGVTAEIREGGVIAPAPPTMNTQIAAHGDVVPNEPTWVVGITTEGTGGNDTIAEDETAVKELVHVAAADATVAIGEGRSLTAEKLTLLDFAGNLNVGVENDPGAVGSTTGSLVLGNNHKHADLTVNAKLADGVRVEVNGVGAVTIAGGSAATNTVFVKDTALKVTGERTFDFDFAAAGTNRVINSANPDDWPTIKFDGAKDVILGERGMHAGYTFLTSSQPSGYYNVRGRIIVTNSLIRSYDVNRSTYTNDEDSAIIIGSRCSGLMEIRAGAIISNRLDVGATRNGGKGLGAVYQTGGEMVALSVYGNDTDLQNGSIIGTSHYGYYNLSDGRLISCGPFCVGYISTGYMRQTGGLFAVTNHPAASKTAEINRRELSIALGNGSIGYYWLSGGRCDLPARLTLCGGYWKNAFSTAELTVDGTGDLDVHGYGIRMIATGDGTTVLAQPHYSFVNINGGGKVRAKGFYDQSKGATTLEPVNRYVAVNFNGGTFRTGASDAALFHSDNSGTHPTEVKAIDHVYVYEGGMTIDTEGKTGNYIDVPITGATGGGVTKVNFSPTAGQAAYHLPPMVKIEGDGIGATAAVDWDANTKTFKGVTVTSPGVGYTSATATVWLGDTPTSYVWAKTNVSCDIAENSNTGSFTKKGAGDLTLEAVNTYGGDTVLAGGVLRLGVTGALPNGSALVPQGGILEVASGVVLPSTIKVKLLDPNPATKYDLIQFAAGFPESLPTFTVEGGGANEEWVVTRRAGKLVVVAKKGFQLIVR